MALGDFPRFSDGELAARRRKTEAMMDEAGVSRLLAYGAVHVGNAIQWITEWPVTHEAALLVTPGETDVLLVQHYNHLPNARRIARQADVRWGGVSTLDTVAGLLEAGGGGRVGLLGPLRHPAYMRLSELAELVTLDAEYNRLRMIKSAEEIERLGVAAGLTDAAVAAVADGAAPGMVETELAALTEAAYLGVGGTNQIHYFAVTSMAEPEMWVPAQFLSDRVIREGDVLFCEISAEYWGYAAQLLRTFTIGAEPTPLISRLHEAADAAFDAVTAAIRPGVHATEIVAASGVIEEMGFSIYDDLVHGYGGGYLPPVLGSASRPHRPIPDVVIEEGMALVVQPNVIVPDESAGVQTGQLGVVTASGWESLHHYPRGLHRLH